MSLEIKDKDLVNDLDLKSIDTDDLIMAYKVLSGETFMIFEKIGNVTISASNVHDVLVLVKAELSTRL
jgi:hypothetical protein